jgi:hypothetical protein
MRAPDQAPLVGRAVLAGLHALERGERPQAFPDEAMDLAKRLADLKDRGGIERLSLAEALDEGIAVAITRSTAAAVDEIIGARYESLGSVEGRLEVVSSHGGRLRCNVYEHVSGKPVRCDFADTLKGVVLAAFDQRVRAHGLIKRDAAGRPRHIQLESLEVLPPAPKESVSIAGLAPDFTGGLDSAEWLEKRWR